MTERKPSADLMRPANGDQVTQAIHVAATLGVVNESRDGPRSAEELAAASGVHTRSLYRLLRALAAVGVFSEDSGRRFSLTPIGDCLRSDVPILVGPWAIFVGRRYAWQAWSCSTACAQARSPCLPPCSRHRRVDLPLAASGRGCDF